MKKILIYSFLLLGFAVVLGGCKKDGNYPGGRISEFVPLLDLRSLYQGEDLTLTKDVMFGSEQIAALVVSDHSEGNLPEGYLVVEDKRRLNELRGITIAMGAAAKNYVPGDSVHINLDGGTLTRIDGIMQVTGISPDKITKVASNRPIPAYGVRSNAILANPSKYESVLLAIVKGGFDPLPAPTDIYSGQKKLNDGFGDITLNTLPSAAFANSTDLPVVGNFYGILSYRQDQDGAQIPEVRMRKKSDAIILSSEVNVAPAVISGWTADPEGTDANNEYIQFLAIQDINFAVTPMSVVTNNNAGASTPGVLDKGWATGGLRTYKFNITSGTAAKGTYFYVGGTNRLINSTNSTSLVGIANFVKTRNYSTSAGEGFGNTTTNLLANSGNAYGIALFRGTEVTEASVPEDVMMVSNNNPAALYTAGPPELGYRIGNTDFYDRIDPLTLKVQEFFMKGTNTLRIPYHFTATAQGYWYKLGGEYSPTKGKWMKARSGQYFIMTNSSTINEIEGIFPLAEKPTEENPGMKPTVLAP